MRNVACEGGPLDGWWFTVDDWETARTAAERMRRTQDEPQGRVLGYVDARRTVSHKRLSIVADVWAWRRHPVDSD